MAADSKAPTMDDAIKAGDVALQAFAQVYAATQAPRWLQAMVQLSNAIEQAKNVRTAA